MGIRIGIGSLKIGQGSTGVDWSSYCTPQYMAVYNAVVGEKPTVAVAVAQNTFVDYLLGNNPLSRDVWSKFDAIIPYGAGMPEANDALLWWNDPTKKAELSATAPTYVVGQGFTGGANKYIDTKFNPSLGVKYTQNDASWVHEIYNGRYASAIYSSGCHAVGNYCIYFGPLIGSSIYVGINGASAVTESSLSATGGLYTAIRTAANSQIFYYGTLAAPAKNSNSVAPLNKTIYNLATNSTSVAENGDDTMGLAMYGSSLDEDDVILINTAWANLKNGITVFDESGDGGIILYFDDHSRERRSILSHLKAKWGATKIGFALNGGQAAYDANKRMWDLKASLGFNIINHSLDHIDWQSYLAAYTVQQFYDSQVITQQAIIENNLGVTDKYYRYAQIYGFDVDLNNLLIANGYKVSSTINILPENYDAFTYSGGLHVIAADLQLYNTAWANIEDILAWAKSNNKVVAFAGHDISASNDAAKIKYEYLMRILDYVRTNNMKIYGYSDIV